MNKRTTTNHMRLAAKGNRFFTIWPFRLNSVQLPDFVTGKVYLGLLLLLAPLQLWGSCTGSSPNWTTTADRASVVTCLTNSSRGDTITVSGSATWASTVTITKGVKLVGSGVVVITNGTGDGTVLEIAPDPTAITNEETFKVTGITIDGANNGQNLLHIQGSAYNASKPVKNIVITGNTFKNTGSSGGGGNNCIGVSGQARGVIYQNTFDRCEYPIRAFGDDDIREFNNSAFSPYAYGSADNLFFETNTIKYSTTFNSAEASAGWVETGQGGRLVMRFNTWDMTNAVGQSEFWDVHGDQNYQGHSTGGQDSTMLNEYYDNFISNAQNTVYRWINHRGGWGMYFDNTYAGGSNPAIQVTQYASGGQSTSGCYDQIVDPTGATYTGPDPTVAYTYFINNKINGSLASASDDPSVNGCGVVENGAISPYGTGLLYGYWNQNNSFNGTTQHGVGRGTIASRPSTCAVGDGWWATDEGSWNTNLAPNTSGRMYRCTATNTWSLYYTPYTYPYTGGSSPTAALTVVSPNGIVGGTECATGSYALGSTVGPCTVTPNPGYSFSGWSSTGSASCTGTGTCGPFLLNTNTTLTASYTPIAATPTFTPGSGTYGSSQSVTIATATSGASIYYTTDGTTPTTSSTLYSGPVTVATSLNLQAIASASGYVDSAVGSASYVINGTLSTPTFSPAAGTYTSPQTVTISSASTVSVIASMTETGNSNSSTGAAPHRNTYTNCATGYNGTAYTPTGQPVGNKYCTTADQSAGVANGGATQSVVSSTITGTGTSALDNGNGAGGTDSPSSITATYGGTGSGCAVGTNNSSAYISGLVLPGAVSNAQAVFGITTQSSPFNTSLLSVTKYNTNGDAGNYLVRQDCASPNTTSVTGEHYEWDDNYNNSAGVYFGFGKHYDFSTSKFYECPQGCSSWKAMKLCPVGGGACLTTYSWPANDYLYSESYEHYNTGCSYTSGTACAFYDAMCLQLWSGGSPVNSLTCYTLQDATTGLTPSFIPINKSTWTHPQFAPQHQWDVNQGSATLTATVPFSNLVAYTPASPTLCYTNDGSSPTGSSGTCTHGTTYSGPVGVSASATLKAIATQSGFVTSAIGSAAYTINPTLAVPVLVGGQAILSGVINIP